MTGWNLKEGKLIETTNSLLPEVSNALISQLYKTTTYKYCFFISLLFANCQLGKNYKISFDSLVLIFAKSYWDLINVHKIPQKYVSEADSGSSIEIMIEDFVKKNPTSNGVYFDSLDSNLQKSIVNLTKSIFKAYVVGAFYSETYGHLYGFSKKEDSLYLNKTTHTFLLENKVILEQLCYFQWLKMCESILNKRNQNVPNLSLLIENVTKRHSLESFKKELISLKDEDCCFYCGKKHSSKFALDHVIPWNFIKDDNLWNLVWSCPQCNSSKLNRIPTSDFIKKLIERNAKLGIDSPDINKLVEVAKKNGVSCDWKK